LGATMANMLAQLWLTNLLGDSGFFSGIIRMGVFVLLYLAPSEGLCVGLL